MIAPRIAPPAAAPRLAPIFVPSLVFSAKVTPAAVPPPMKAPRTPPPIAQPSQILGSLMFAQPASVAARNASSELESRSLCHDLCRISPPIHEGLNRPPSRASHQTRKRTASTVAQQPM